LRLQKAASRDQALIIWFSKKDTGQLRILCDWVFRFWTLSYDSWK